MYFVENVKSQLTSSIGLEDVVVRTSLSSEQIKAILDSPPACIDPVIWKQAIQMNPDEGKMIPVPMLGFSALHQRLKKQEEMSEGHQNRSELLQREIRTLEVPIIQSYRHIIYPFYRKSKQIQERKLRSENEIF